MTSRTSRSITTRSITTRSITTRSVTTAAAALLVASGLAVGTGAAVASADTAACATAQTVTYNNINTGLQTYGLTKEVVGDGTAAPGGTVTFRTTVSGAGALVSRIDDFHPAGFELVQARESVWKLVGGQSWTTVTDDVLRDSATNSVYKKSAGWTTAGQAKATLETTYRVPADATPGEKLNTGAGMTLLGLIDGRKVANPINTCVTIREPNAAETVTGSLDGLGLGSLTSGSSALGDIGANPALFSADLINGIDLGQLIGGIAGS